MRVPKNLLFIAFLSCCLQATGQVAKTFSIKPEVDERVELLSIVFRLAGNDEYITDHFKAYVADIHAHFDRFKNHPLIPYTRKIADKNRIGFDAVMFMAVHLSQPPALQPLVPFGNGVPEPRWPLKDAAQFVQLLQQFYHDADAALFFKKHRALYDTAESRFAATLQAVDFNWFERYYGRLPESKFHLIIGVGNGGMSFGPRVQLANGKEDLYAIVGTWDIDPAGNPVFPLGSYLHTIIHEYNHSFINPVVEWNRKKLEPGGKKVFGTVQPEMQRLAYGNWKTMIDESLVRASVIRYLKKHIPDSSVVHRSIADEQRRGFVWMEELVQLLHGYEGNKQLYPTLSLFMPQVIRFYDSLANHIRAMKKAFDARRPRVISLEPFANGARDVGSSVQEIIIHFSEPLDASHMPVMYLGGTTAPETDSMPAYFNNGRSLRVSVRLKPGTSYGFMLGDENFHTPAGAHLIPYEIRFSTKK